MSMVMTLYALETSTFDRIVAEPVLIAKRLMGCQPGSRDAALLPRRQCDLDKAWEAIHFVLTGGLEQRPDPLGFLFGGQAVGDDLGLGPARALHPADVKASGAALESISEAEFRGRFFHRALLKESIYAIGDDETRDLEYVAGRYHTLRAFVIEAARRVEGVIITLA
jgi:hypothetical protein